MLGGNGVTLLLLDLFYSIEIDLHIPLAYL